ncbi:hypothetical protein B0H17DRAFT_1140658 [Mycena rosella]|uniref:Uncharacterized protein n=1 Tax=Mycena rosella TaxID=1033263 RepID=A0AAD7GB23_MYCRO|nr:hypothetical protein B0H17DRAFT_1140658 [Mycena rosella]
MSSRLGPLDIDLDRALQLQLITIAVRGEFPSVEHTRRLMPMYEQIGDIHSLITKWWRVKRPPLVDPGCVGKHDMKDGRRYLTGSEALHRQSERCVGPREDRDSNFGYGVKGWGVPAKAEENFLLYVLHDMIHMLGDSCTGMSKRLISRGRDNPSSASWIGKLSGGGEAAHDSERRPGPRGANHLPYMEGPGGRGVPRRAEKDFSTLYPFSNPDSPLCWPPPTGSVWQSHTQRALLGCPSKSARSPELQLGQSCYLHQRKPDTAFDVQLEVGAEWECIRPIADDSATGRDTTEGHYMTIQITAFSGLIAEPSASCLEQLAKVQQARDTRAEVKSAEFFHTGSCYLGRGKGFQDPETGF